MSQERDFILNDIKSYLVKAQNLMKIYANNGGVHMQ